MTFDFLLKWVSVVNQFYPKENYRVVAKNERNGEGAIFSLNIYIAILFV